MLSTVRHFKRVNVFVGNCVCYCSKGVPKTIRTGHPLIYAAAQVEEHPRVLLGIEFIKIRTYHQQRRCFFNFLKLFWRPIFIENSLPCLFYIATKRTYNSGRIA